MNIDTLDVVDKVKLQQNWEFSNFRPGLVGGHCIVLILIT